MDANIEFVRGLYQAFIEGRIDAVLAGCAEDIVWECVGNPAHVPHAGRFSGRDGVARFFDKVGGTYEFQLFSPDRFYAAGDRVICLGHIETTAKATGRRADSRFVHLFLIRNGRVAEFLEFADTASIAIGAGTLCEPAKVPA